MAYKEKFLLSTDGSLEKRKMANDQKNLTDCYWFLQNQCLKGETCEYRHNQASLHNSSICKFWIESKCLNEDCNFRHPSGITKERSQINCIYYSQGTCTKGEACPFSHSRTGVPPPPNLQLLQNEQILRNIQEERKKEEEKLAKLKAERDLLESNASKKSNQQRKVADKRRPEVVPQNKKSLEVVPRNKKSLEIAPSKKKKDGPGTFVKTFDEIMKAKKKENDLLDGKKQQGGTRNVQNTEESVDHKIQQKKVPESFKKKSRKAD